MSITRRRLNGQPSNLTAVPSSISTALFLIIALRLRHTDAIADQALNGLVKMKLIEGFPALGPKSDKGKKPISAILAEIHFVDHVDGDCSPDHRGGDWPQNQWKADKPQMRESTMAYKRPDPCFLREEGENIQRHDRTIYRIGVDCL